MFFLFNSGSFAQKSNEALELVSYEEQKEFEIAGIEVRGNEESDTKTIIALSGLHVGDKIKIPGAKVSSALRKLWKLKLFSDVQVLKEKEIGEKVFLEIVVKEIPVLSKFTITGLKKNHKDDLETTLQNYLIPGTIITENIKNNSKARVLNHFHEKGFLNTKVRLNERADGINRMHLNFTVDLNEKVKISEINITGNNNVSEKKIKKLLAGTKQQSELLKGSRFVQETFEADKKNILAYYQTQGFRDAKIGKEKISKNEKGNLILDLKIEEGIKYHFGKISWKGNSKFSTEILNKVLNIAEGSTYNQDLLNTRLQFDMDSKDVSSLYMDRGHLFFNAQAVEIALRNDTIDLEIRLQEGPVAKIGKVIISGNTTTKEDVIRREIRTQPGEAFSRADIIRSQREIINLGYFDPGNLEINTPVNPEKGTVDIEYKVSERPSDQLELSAGWQPGLGDQGGALVGTLGMTFNNFSVKNIFNSKAWNPIPQGDGQRLSLRAQSSGKSYQSFNASFTEPWLGGKKPTNLTVAGFYTRRFFDSESGGQEFSVLGGNVSLATRLRWPDDNFVSTTSVNFNRIDLNNWTTSDFVTTDGNQISEGRFYNIYLKQTIARNTVNHPIFPTKGSFFSLSAQLTPPYSLLGIKGEEGGDSPNAFKWLEYNKWEFKGEVYKQLAKKLVFKGSVKAGTIGKYNSASVLSPFERFRLGGNGTAGGQGFTGVDPISLRGYDDAADFSINSSGGATVFNKYSLELRYLLMAQPAVSAYVLAFADAGNIWNETTKYDPFDLKKSAGLGLRLHLPMFGTMGFDYGVGFDKDASGTGSYLSQYGKLSLILGFEPE